MEGSLKTAFGNCSIEKRQTHIVYGCDGAHQGDDCGICNIMDYAEIFHFPVVLFFKNRVLKGQIFGFQPITGEKLEDCISRIKEYGKHQRRGSRLNNFIFHFMNVVTFCSFATGLRDLWQAQGINVIARRTMKYPRESWKRWFDLKKEEWRATGIMAALMISAAATLIGMANHAAPRLLCVASILCNLGCAMASTTLLCCFENVNAARLAWYEGGGLFVLALSAPGGWLRWGIVTLLGALLAMLWMSQPMAANILGSILVAVQLILFFNQSLSFRGGVQLFTNALPFTPDATKSCSELLEATSGLRAQDADVEAQSDN